METLIDELAAATKQGPGGLPARARWGQCPRHHAAPRCRLPLSQVRYGQRKLPAGSAWGVAVHESFESVVACVVVASVRGKGADRQVSLHEVHAG